MPVSCPHCGAAQPDNVVLCANCGKPLPAGAPSGRPPATGREIIAYTGLVLRYTLLPVLIVSAILCAGWLICVNWVR